MFSIQTHNFESIADEVRMIVSNFLVKVEIDSGSHFRNKFCRHFRNNHVFIFVISHLNEMSNWAMYFKIIEISETNEICTMFLVKFLSHKIYPSIRYPY